MQKSLGRAIFSTGCAAALLTAGMTTTAYAANDNNAHLEGIVVGTYQAGSDSQLDGAQTHSEGNAQLYLFGTLDMGPGTWNAEVRAGTTPRTNGVSAYGSNGLVGETTDAEGDGRVAITQFFYELPVGPGQFRLGLLDPAAVLDTNAVDNDEYTQFMADAFVNNMTIGFPSFVLGAAYQGQATHNIDYKVFAGSDSGLEDGDHHYSNVFEIGGQRDGHDKGAFTGVEVGWQANGYSLRGGVWYDSGNVDHSDTGTGSVNPYGVYALAGIPAGQGQLAIRAGIANEDAQQGANFLSLAYQLPVELGQRNTTLGAAVARTGDSNEWRNSKAIYQAEAYWRINIIGSFYVSPDIQYIRHANFDPNEDGTVIGGVRIGAAF